jgi:probable phosphoglycerate mutase
MKYIYLVRHGETVLNEEHIRQGSEGGLSDNGKKQVDRLGKRLSKFNIKKIFSSDFQRGRETAQIINHYLNVEIVYTHLLTERKNPSSIVGKKFEDQEVVEKINMIDKSYHKANFRVEDEENFEDLKNRAIELRKYLERNAASRTLCITHGIFLKMFLCIIKYGDDLKVEEYIKNSVFNPANNAGITVVSLDKPLFSFSKPSWKIILYNETEANQDSESV